MQDSGVKGGHIVRRLEGKLVVSLGQTVDLGEKNL